MICNRLNRFRKNVWGIQLVFEYAQTRVIPYMCNRGTCNKRFPDAPAERLFYRIAYDTFFSNLNKRVAKSAMVIDVAAWYPKIRGPKLVLAMTQTLIDLMFSSH